MLEIFKESKGIQSSEQALVPEATATAVFLGSPDKLPNQPAGSTARPATLPSRLEEKLLGHSSLYLRSAALTVAIIYAEQRIRAQTQTSFSQPLPLHHTVPCLTWAAFPAPYSLLSLPETGEVFLNTLHQALFVETAENKECLSHVTLSPLPLVTLKSEKGIPWLMAEIPQPQSWRHNASLRMCLGKGLSTIPKCGPG